MVSICNHGSNGGSNGSPKLHMLAAHPMEAFDVSTAEPATARARVPRHWHNLSGCETTNVFSLRLETVLACCAWTSSVINKSGLQTKNIWTLEIGILNIAEYCQHWCARWTFVIQVVYNHIIDIDRHSDIDRHITDIHDLSVETLLIAKPDQAGLLFVVLQVLHKTHGLLTSCMPHCMHHMPWVFKFDPHLPSTWLWHAVTCCDVFPWYEAPRSWRRLKACGLNPNPPKSPQTLTYLVILCLLRSMKSQKKKPLGRTRGIWDKTCLLANTYSSHAQKNAWTPSLKRGESHGWGINGYHIPDLGHPWTQPLPTSTHHPIPEVFFVSTTYQHYSGTCHRLSQHSSLQPILGQGHYRRLARTQGMSFQAKKHCWYLLKGAFDFLTGNYTYWIILDLSVYIVYGIWLQNFGPKWIVSNMF